MKPLYKEDLDNARCATPGCDHTGHDGLMIHSNCHPEAPTWAEHKNGLLTIFCSECERRIVVIAVASTPTSQSISMSV